MLFQMDTVFHIVWNLLLHTRRLSSPTETIDSCNNQILEQSNTVTINDYASIFRQIEQYLGISYNQIDLKR